MGRYPGYVIVRRLRSQRRPIFEAIEQGAPWRRVALALRGRGPHAAAALRAMAAAARRLAHVGIAPLVAEHDDALAFGWASGRGLDRAVVPDDARLELAIQIAELVAHAHERGVVLRDVKPGNLLLDRRDGRLHVTLVDLDLARVEGAVGEASEASGTWGWSAPEQAALEPRWIDRRSDLYALGTTLAFVFAGQPLFSRGARAIREQLGEDRLAALPVAPAVRAILRALVAVERDARRPASEVVAALRALRGEQVPAAREDRAIASGGDAAYATFRAHVAAMAGGPLVEPLAVARVALRLDERAALERCARAVPDGAAMLALQARACIADGDRAAAIARLDRITAVPADADEARDVLATEVTVLRPQRARQLATRAADRAVVREGCEAWLAQLGALTWHERLAWALAEPAGAAAVGEMTDTVLALGGAPPDADDRDADATAAHLDLLFTRGALEPAYALLMRALEHAPESVALWRVLHRAARAAGRPDTAQVADRAIAMLEQAVPSAAADEAITASITAVMAAPHAHAAWLACAERMIAGDRIADALELLASCERGCGPDAAIDRLRAHAWLALDEAERAIAAGVQALRGGTDQPALWHTLALAWIRTGAADDARNAIAMLQRTGDSMRRARTLAFYASLVDPGASTAERLARAGAALAEHPGDGELTVMRALVLLAAGDAEVALRLHADPLLSRSAQLALRGLAPELAGALEAALSASTAPAVHIAATLYFLAIDQPVTAAMFVRDHSAQWPALAAEAFLRSDDLAALRAVSLRLPDLAERLADRLR